jgi:very-short-patch-repair endonuclease
MSRPKCGFAKSIPGRLAVEVDGGDVLGLAEPDAKDVRLHRLKATGANVIIFKNKTMSQN